MRAPFPWVILIAYAILWTAPKINRWLDQPPRPKPDPPTLHRTPVQARIIRRGSGRELERHRDMGNDR